MKQLLSKIAASTLDLLFPIKCAGCLQESKILCGTCMPKLTRLISPYFQLCDSPNTLYACIGLNFSSAEGEILRSTDGDDTWHRFYKGVETRSTTFCIAINHQAPQQMYFCTRKGQVFGTHDGSNSWKGHNLPETAGDVKSIAYTTA